MNTSAMEQASAVAEDAAADDSADAPAQDLDLNAVLDVDVTLALEVGRARMSIGQLLKLNQGSLIELNRKATEPMDVTVNGTLFARGEIVVVDEQFGIRLIDVVSPADRISKLG